MLPFKKSIEAVKKFNLQFKNKQSFEFFFYADKEDDADNLAIILHSLGYSLYERTTTPELSEPPFSVTGHTRLLSPE